ncbi:MAG: arginine--tRNA ligase [Nitrospirota bacterium]|nr:arginine--tRNA ligase [Nitrospirota bacterium]
MPKSVIQGLYRRLEVWLERRILEVFKLSESLDIAFERPKEGFGDLATPVAFQLARLLRMPPIEIAKMLEAQAVDLPQGFSALRAAPPGYLNAEFDPEFLKNALVEVLEHPELFGRFDDGSGKRAQVEFVSANPTGPLTVGHGRQAVLGSSIANLLEALGFEVTREYYYNDAGRQMRVLGESIRARYLELLGEPASFPEDGYQGDYIREIARQIFEDFADRLKTEVSHEPFQKYGERVIFEDIQRTLQRLDIRFDVFFGEHTLYEDGSIERVLERLNSLGLLYEKDGALWFEAKAFGQPKDRVFRKASGEYTYRLPDIAYHVQKLGRGFDLIVDVLGADHHLSSQDVLTTIKVLGQDVSRIRIVLHQFVTLVRGGERVKVSTRKATYVTLDELIDMVGKDACRFFFLLRKADTHLDFDIDLARKQGEENPVYYVQYAHARICSVFEVAKNRGVALPNPGIEALQTLSEAELPLLKAIFWLEHTLREAARELEPHRMVYALMDIAGLFHSFYNHNRILESPEEIRGMRLLLVQGLGVALRRGLSLLNVTAPEKM